MSGAVFMFAVSIVPASMREPDIRQLFDRLTFLAS